MEKGTFEEEFDDCLLHILTELKARREAEGKHPNHVMFVELQKEIKSSLNRMHIDKKIKAGNTVNDKYIQVL